MVTPSPLPRSFLTTVATGILSPLSYIGCQLVDNTLKVGASALSAFPCNIFISYNLAYLFGWEKRIQRAVSDIFGPLSKNVNPDSTWVDTGYQSAVHNPFVTWFTGNHSTDGAAQPAHTDSNQKPPQFEQTFHKMADESGFLQGAKIAFNPICNAAYNGLHEYGLAISFTGMNLAGGLAYLAYQEGSTTAKGITYTLASAVALTASVAGLYFADSNGPQSPPA